MNWIDFLSKWQEDVKFIVSLMPDDVRENAQRIIASNFPFTRSPVSQDTIDRSEERIGYEFPNDLREFYATTNGWYQYGFDAHDLVIQPVSEIDAISKGPRDYIRDVKGYLDARPRNLHERSFISSEDSEKILMLTNYCNDGCYIAAPSRNGQWEFGVILFHGAPEMFSSFESMMVSEKERCLHNLRGSL